MSAPADPTVFALAMQRVGEAGDRIAASLHDRGCTTAEVDAALTMLGAMMWAYLNHLFADPDHPRFMPGAGFYTHIGTPNPDTFYRSAAIDGSGTYRLTGDRGTAPEVTLMPLGGPTATGLQTFPPFDFDDLDLLQDGRLDVVLGPERPPGHDGDWWQIEPEVRSLMLRSVSADWGRHREPLVAIVRLDTDPRRPRAASDKVLAMLEALPMIVERSVAYGLRKVDQLRTAGIVNRVTTVDYSGSGGLADQWYHEGVFDLRIDEALLMEVPLPAGARFSLSLTDPLFCTIDWTHAQSSLNHRQAAVDDDGTLRVVIAPADPGVPNWLDTTGRSTGALQCRWTGCADAPEPSFRVISGIDVRDHLPGGTPTISPDARDEALRARSAAAQLRALW